MFAPLGAKFDFPEAERRVLRFWEQQAVFARSLECRRGAPRFVFYEGPPTANGMPHPGHCLTRAIKDLFPRYKTMRGYLVERKAGWDTHGLPVEIEVCRELGINTKEQIEAYGVDRFVQRCVESVFRYVRQWEEMTDRLGFWINLDEAYVTYHQSYVESVWWSLKTLFERGLLYQGHKVVWWWAQGGTALSSGEVGEGYRTVEDPSVYVRFPLVREESGTSHALSEEPRASARAAPNAESGSARGEPRGLKSAAPLESAAASGEPRGLKSAAAHESIDPAKRVSLLVWTTTPWTLISNHFAAVHPLFDYVLVHDRTTDEYFYIADELVDEVARKVGHQFVPVGKVRGQELVGLRYEPPFDCYYRRLRGQTAPLKAGGVAHVGWRVLPADFVTLDTGTGIVHQAPAYGEVDFELLQTERQRFADFDAIPLLNAVAPDGTFTDEAPERYRGRWVKDCDEQIMQELAERGLLLHRELIRHEYPFCPRSEDDPLIQYARKSWFVRTSQFKDEFLENNAGIYWLPGHIREGRFGDFLRNNVDWALSRERYWGTPLPIWVCEKTGKMEAIGSYAELLAKPGVQGTEVWERAKRENPDLPEHLKVHKPYIDAITYDSPFDTDGGPRASARADAESASAEAERAGAGALEEPRASARAAPGAGDDSASGEARGLESAAGRAPVRRARMRRVPEVIDCWWDAGCMPFAQWGFPHVPGSVQTFAERFPCDFISEAIDQTRGWFYGLLAISTLLFGRSRDESRLRAPGLPRPAAGHPYKACIVLGHVMGEDGLKMSKRAKNYREPDYIFDHYGADAMRWYFFSAQTPWTSIRFQEAAIRDAHREFLVRLYNVLSFFTIYANIDGFDPGACGGAEAASQPGSESGTREGSEAPGREGSETPARECSEVPGREGSETPARECGEVPGREGSGAPRREGPRREGDDEPRASARAVATVRRPVAQRSELDRWIISELHRTVSFVRERMDRFENFPAAGRLNQFVDALSNWYVRRSRERFWRPLSGGPADQDKWDAYHTLYEVLVTLSKLIAPFTPFFAETMYQLLVRRERAWTEPDEADGAVPLSVHLCDYPEPDAALIDEQLAGQMELVRQIVSLGRAARTAAGLKVRQPLARAEVILARQEHQQWLEAHRGLIADELNIKQVDFAAEADRYVRYQVKANFKRIGPKYGPLAPRIAAALSAMSDPGALRRALFLDGVFSLEVEGQEVTLGKDDIEIRLEAKPGWSAAQGRVGVVVVSTELTPELRAEGLVRELIHQVQGLRKEQNLAYEARIELYVQASEEFRGIIARYAEAVRGECLARRIAYAPPPGGPTRQVRIGGHAVELAVVPV